MSYKKRTVIEELVPSFLDVNVPRSSDLLTPLLLSVWKGKKLNEISELLLLSLYVMMYDVHMFVLSTLK